MNSLLHCMYNISQRHSGYVSALKADTCVSLHSAGVAIILLISGKIHRVLKKTPHVASHNCIHVGLPYFKYKLHERVCFVVQIMA